MLLQSRPRSLGLVLTVIGCVLATTTLEDFNTEEGPCLQSENLGLAPFSGSCFFEFCGRKECYREECKPNKETCENKARLANPTPGTCRRNLDSDPFPEDHPEDKIFDVTILNCTEVDPVTNPEPLPPLFNATVQFLGVIPAITVRLAAPGVNSSVPSKSSRPDPNEIHCPLF